MTPRRRSGAIFSRLQKFIAVAFAEPMVVVHDRGSLNNDLSAETSSLCEELYTKPWTRSFHRFQGVRKICLRSRAQLPGKELV